MKFRVVCDDSVHEFEFDRERVTVGRGPSNDVVLEDSLVSRRHGAFERQTDGRLIWSCTGPTSFHRAGTVVDHTSDDEPRRWELADGDVVQIAGAEAAIAIEVLTAETTPAPRPYFVDLGPAPADLGAILLPLAERMAREVRPDAILEAFTAMLQHAGLSRGVSTLVVLSGPDEFHNDAWAFADDEACGLTADPTSVLGVTTSEISERWRSNHCLAVVGDQVLIPVGDGSLDALIVYRAAGLGPDAVRTAAAAATALRPFASLFVARLRAERAHGALVEENRYFRGRQRQHYLYKELVCESRAMKAVHDRLKQMRNEDRPVLFAGEAGTGKELLARLLHHESPRTDQMIMRMNCAEFADETANFELFGVSADGHAAPRKGVFELARQGTVLLEEIDVLPPMVQAKLCRTLKENEVRRIGESVGRPVGARVIASVHRDVGECVAEGRLRRDLYLLLRDQTIVVPSLRDRREDILPLARKFLGVYASRYGRRVDGFSAEAESRMLDHFWPGNVRELQARIEASVLGTNGPRVGVAQLGLS